MSGETILIIEDEEALRRGLKDNFEFSGYAVHVAADGEKGLDLLLSKRPDLVILDIMLPRVNGYEICRRARAEGLEMPILLLTAKGQEEDIILGLNLGADDYITKPFSVDELLARVNAFLRRGRRDEEQAYAFGAFQLDLVSQQLLRDSSVVELTPKELALLTLLVRRPGRAFTRDEILRLVWGDDVFVTARSVDRCVATLRRKIEADPKNPRFLHTLREIGYRFETGERSPN